MWFLLMDEGSANASTSTSMGTIEATLAVTLNDGYCGEIILMEIMTGTVDV